MKELNLGSRTLQPRRQLLAGDKRVALGKRALDILSVLAEANGEIVTKDELLDAVWPDVTVEENALQVHVAALRKALGPEGGRLKTIRGIGYQLELANGAAEGALPGVDSRATAVPREPAAGFEQGTLPPGEQIGGPSASTQAGTLSLRRKGGRLIWVIGLSAPFLAALAGAVALWNWSAAPSKEVVRVEALSSAGGEQARLLAQTIHGDLVEVLNESGIQLAGSRKGGLFTPVPKANRVVRGKVTQTGGRLTVQVSLEEPASGTVLWSKNFERDIGSADRLATEASVAAARTLFTIRDFDLQRDLELDPATIALHIRVGEMTRSSQLTEEGGARALVEQIVAREPRSAMGHGLLALTLVGEGGRLEHGARAAALANARREASKAIALDPFAAGPAYDALYGASRLEHPRQIAQAENWILAGLDNAPRFPFLWMRECLVLIEVGRAREALPLCQRALALHPFAEPILHAYARALSESGQDQQAYDVINLAAHYNPDHRVTRIVRLQLAAFGDRPEDALALLQDPATRPELRRRETAVLARYIRGAAKTAEHERNDLAEEITTMALQGHMRADFAVMALAALDERDRAFAVLRSDHMDPILHTAGLSFLFQPVTAPLRADARFWTVAVDLGLAQHWTRRGRWPDMCEDELELEYCREQTQRALFRRSG